MTYSPTHPLSFSLTAVSIFSTLTLFLFMIDLVPEPRVSAEETSSVATLTATTLTPEVVAPVVEIVHDTVPTRVVIPRIKVDAPVITPQNTDADILDRALLSGAVRYPSSAGAGEKGTMLLFGHSSYLPIVHNKAFQTFNELGKLEKGDTVEVYTTTGVFTYTVSTVRLAYAEDTIVRFDTQTPTLTLSTCNTFGSKQERWIAEAHLTETRTL